MTIAAWVLCILFVIILGLLLSIVTYHPTAAVQPVHEVTRSSSMQPKEQKQEPVDYSAVGMQQLHEIHFRIPSIDLMMNVQTLAHCTLIHWMGSVKHADKLLISIAREDCRNACIEAVKRIVDTGGVPSNEFWLVFPFSQQVEKEACDDAREYLRDKGIHINGVLMDGSDNENLFGRLQYQALIGVETGAYMEIEVNGNSRRKQVWIDGINARKEFPMSINPVLDQTVHALKKDIPWEIRFELMLHMRKGMDDLLTVLPDSWTWMQASLEKKKSTLILRAPSTALLQDTFAYLNEDASRNSLYLVNQRELHPSKQTECGTWIFRHTASCAMGCFQVDRAVPVSVPESGSLGQFAEWNVCRYMPLTEHKKESPESAILFYKELIVKA